MILRDELKREASADMDTSRARLQSVLRDLSHEELEAGASSCAVFCHNKEDLLGAVQTYLLPQHPKDLHYIQQATRRMLNYFRPFSQDTLQRVYNCARQRMTQQGKALPALDNKKQLRGAVASYIIQDNAVEEGEVLPTVGAVAPSGQPGARQNINQADNSAIYSQ